MVEHHPGAIVGERFELVRPLGAGGMATVWEARDRTNDERVALKLLHPKLAANVEAVRRIEREATLLIALRHPNIAACISPSVADDTIAIAMELIEGKRLDHAIGERARSDEPWSIDEARRLFEKLCGAVTHAHEHGVLHRDLKPHNLILVDDPDIRIKVLDFGVAKIVATASSDATTQGRRIGSLNYGAPEQLAGDPADARADVFALGVILFEMLTLKRAWAQTPEGERAGAFDGRALDRRQNDLVHVLERIRFAERPRPSDERSGLPEALDDVVARATAVDPDARYASVAELLAAFVEATDETSPARIAPDAAPTVARAPEGPEPDLAATRLASEVLAPTEVLAEPPETSVTRPTPKPEPESPRWPWAFVAVAIAAAGAGAFVLAAPAEEPAELAPPPVEVEVEARPRVVVEAKPSATIAEEPPPPPPKAPRRRVRRRAPREATPPPPADEPIEVLRDRILRRAARLEHRERRTTIERLATTSAMTADRAGLELARKKLVAAERAEASP